MTIEEMEAQMKKLQEEHAMTLEMLRQLEENPAGEPKMVEVFGADDEPAEWPPSEPKQRTRLVEATPDSFM